MSILEVAKRAGVSKSTVSRVINKSAPVAPEIAEAVHRAMKEMNYEPPVRRRGPKPGSRRGIRTGRIALLVMGLNAADLYRLPVFPGLLAGIERGLAEQGLNLVLANLREGEAGPVVLSGHEADGLLLWGKWDQMPDQMLSRLREHPVVWIMREHSDEEGLFDHVFYNNIAVGQLAARYLLRRGHTRVAFLNVNPEHTAFARRQEEFTATMKEAGGQVLACVRQPKDRHTGYAVYQPLVDQLLNAPDRPTALFVPADAQLPEVYQALQLRGVQPMTDLDIVSCDNEQQFLSRVSPRPATIDINLELVGLRSVQQLLWRMRNPQERSRISVLVEPTLVEPPSSAPAPRLSTSA